MQQHPMFNHHIQIQVQEQHLLVQPPEPKTNVIVTAGAQPQPNIVPASMNASGNKVPSISSSNPDNFYIYYSMANYNVVM